MFAPPGLEGDRRAASVAPMEEMAEEMAAGPTRADEAEGRDRTPCPPTGDA